RNRTPIHREYPRIYLLAHVLPPERSTNTYPRISLELEVEKGYRWCDASEVFLQEMEHSDTIEEFNRSPTRLAWVTFPRTWFLRFSPQRPVVTYNSCRR